MVGWNFPRPGLALAALRDDPHVQEGGLKAIHVRGIELRTVMIVDCNGSRSTRWVVGIPEETLQPVWLLTRLLRCWIMSSSLGWKGRRRRTLIGLEINRIGSIVPHQRSANSIVFNGPRRQHITGHSVAAHH